MSSDREALARIDALLAVGARVAAAGDPLRACATSELVETSGLSREGVALALDRHLETSARPEELARLVASAPRGPRAWIVPASTVCTAALRAIAIAIAGSPHVSVRPSRRDPGLAPLLARELARSEAFANAGGTIALVSELAPAPGDVVHAYGSDATLRAIAASLPDEARLEGHGTGFGLALVTAGADPSVAANAIVEDVIVFDQAGCLSPRLVLVEGDAVRGHAIARALRDALDSAGVRVPRGRIDRAALARFEATFAAVGEVESSPHGAVALDPEPAIFTLPPAARALLVAPFADGETLASYLAGVSRFVTTIGADDHASPFARVLAAHVPGARLAALGAMQRPPLDGPVDRRKYAVDRPVRAVERR